MKLRVNLNGKGLGVFFKPYEIKAIIYMIKERKVTTREVFLHVNNSGVRISRGAIIGFLNKIVDGNMFDMGVQEVDTCKGGWRGVYILNSVIKAEYDVMMHVHRLIKESVENEALSLGDG